MITLSSHQFPWFSNLLVPVVELEMVHYSLVGLCNLGSSQNLKFSSKIPSNTLKTSLKSHPSSMNYHASIGSQEHQYSLFRHGFQTVPSQRQRALLLAATTR
jgi:hypothetical protein